MNAVPRRIDQARTRGAERQRLQRIEDAAVEAWRALRAQEPQAAAQLLQNALPAHRLRDESTTDEPKRYSRCECSATEALYFFRATDFDDPVGAAERFLASLGISIGTRQGSEPRGLIFGPRLISKWRNLDHSHRDQLHGYLEPGGGGPKVVVAHLRLGRVPKGFDLPGIGVVARQSELP